MESICRPRYLQAAPGLRPKRSRSTQACCSDLKPDALTRSFPMLDIAYLVVGALFLGLCALYALACDNL
jgi:hypothetical protein